MAEIRLLNFFQEWLILKGFENQDKDLSKRYNEKLVERNKLSVQVRIKLLFIYFIVRPLNFVQNSRQRNHEQIKSTTR
jgi:hypothetical protein